MRGLRWARLVLHGMALLAVVYLGCVSTVVVPNLVRGLGHTSSPKVKADITALANAVVAYAIDHDGRFPESLDLLLIPRAPAIPEFDEFPRKPWRVHGGGSSYLDCDALPLDPWGRAYRYELPAPGSRAFRVFSLGADGQPGGEGDDRDIDNLLIKEGKI